MDLLFEVGTLRHVPRMWRQFGGHDFANVAEHSFRVAWIALVLAKWAGASSGRVVELALIHDLAESRTGDTNYVNRIYVRADHEAAMRDAGQGTCLDQDLHELWNEWTKVETLESQLAHDADQIDCDFELREREVLGSEFPTLIADTRTAVRSRLHTEFGRQLFDRVKGGDPTRWHRTTNNRLTVGDWAGATTDESG